ncbi:SRP40, C-terminal domain-containing protein [Lentinula aciculospora]|uniref:SRP40, C-terminal domain-containing protein n=1 Tax=Lentinula aciculospora TaxID=153920 RepID=A0A9W9A6M7_9AGAR|nr:SRP40, C-terminal domain-containing protein [Lentinula aciculospora]
MQDVSTKTTTAEAPKLGKRRATNERFQRINPDKVPAHLIRDNRYENKAAPENDYGAKAHADLIVTRGAGFRKEKNKKKRGSYKGGNITMESHSYKFPDTDD